MSNQQNLEPVVELRTKNCIYCLSKAIHWTCHVHKQDEIVTAGWCDACVASIQTNASPICPALYRLKDCSLIRTYSCGGKWTSRYGLSARVMWDNHEKQYA